MGHVFGGRGWLDDLRGDLVYAARGLASAPGFTAVAVLTLALAIGATSAVFSVVNAVLLRPLPYAPDSDRLVRLMARLPATDRPGGPLRRVTLGLTAEEMAEIRSKTRAFSEVGLVSGALMGLTGADDAARLEGARVSASVLAMVGAHPIAGRTLTAADETPGHTDVVLLGHATWLRHFAGDPAVVGRTITLDTVLGARTSRAYTVVGIMPPSFTFPTPQAQFWMPPASAPPGQANPYRGQLLGKLAPGVQASAALAEIDPLVRTLRQHGPDARYELTRERDEVAAPVEPALRVLAGAVGLLLLIGCVNLANLLLARGVARRREVGVRMALGAGRGRLARQALTESLLLASLGGLAGTLLAAAAVRWLRVLATASGRMDLVGGAGFPRLQEIAIDGEVLAFSAVVSLSTAVVFGLGPALWQAGTAPSEVLRLAGAAAAATSRRTARARGPLVVVQVALAMALLVGATLLARSAVNLARVDPGYSTSRVLTFQVGLPAAAYPDARLVAFAEDLTARLRAMPGVVAAGYANQLPLVQLRDTAGGLWPTPDPTRRGAPDAADARFVSRQYLDVMGMRIVAGRGFTEADGAGQPRALLVNEALARRDFPGRDPVGLTVYVGRDPGPWSIVGVVADVRQFGVDRAPEPQFFADLRQWTGTGPLFPVGAYYALRADGDPGALVASIRAAARDLDRQAALFNVAPMSDLVNATLIRPRLYALLLGLFAAIGGATAAIGIYGLLAFTVAERTTEMGIRVALGAERRQVLRLVLGHGLTLAALGIAAGLAGSAALTTYLESLLFGVTRLDAATLSAVSVLFLAVAALAAYGPARRATRIDPIAAIRSE